MARLKNRSIRIDTDYSLSPQEWQAQEKRQLDRAAARARANSPGDLVGELLRWQRADGHAVYMVTSERPLTLAHVDVGDAYFVEGALIRGLTLGDARAMVEQERRWREHMERAEDFYDELEVGSTVHYHNGFGSFVRCEVVKAPDDEACVHAQEGDTCLRPVALVGNWREHDLQHDSYHVEEIREGRLFKPSASNIYENPDAESTHRHGDPSAMTPLDFVPAPPEPTARELAAERLGAMAREVVGSGGESATYFVTTDGETVAVLLNRGPGTLDRALRLAESLPGEVVVEDETGVVWENGE